jgi:hypothetical protein
MKTDSMVKRLRWVMVFVILFDFADTLLGQSATFWQHPETMNEHNRLVHAIAAHGYWAVILFMLLYTVGAFLFVSLARRRLALVALFAFILCDYHGAAAWIERHWGFGNTGFIIYGIVLAAVIVLVGFPSERAKVDAS